MWWEQCLHVLGVPGLLWFPMVNWTTWKVITGKANTQYFHQGLTGTKYFVSVIWSSLDLLCSLEWVPFLSQSLKAIAFKHLINNLLLSPQLFHWLLPHPDTLCRNGKPYKAENNKEPGKSQELKSAKYLLSDIYIWTQHAHDNINIRRKWIQN